MGNDSFVDFYEVLQVSPNADAETIQRVYRFLALRYHPDNKETGDTEMFKLVIEAHRTLSDPRQRVEYDLEYQTTRKLRWKIFDQPKAALSLEGEKSKRRGILGLLYTKRMNQPDAPGLTIMELEDLLGCPREHLEFSIWYLREQQWIERTDSGRYLIRAKGVDVVEESGGIRPDSSRLLPAPPESEAQRPSQSWFGPKPGFAPAV